MLWLWNVRGKGNKLRSVPVTAAMLDAYRRYRIARGLPFFDHEPFVSPPSGHFAARDDRLFFGTYDAPKPVSVIATPEAIRDGLNAAIDLATLKKNHKKLPVNLRGITHTQVYNDVRAVAKAAVAIATEDKDKDAIATLTPHFFRHRRALDLLKGGLRLTQLKQYLGHSSIETTTAYTNQEAIDLAIAVLALEVKH